MKEKIIIDTQTFILYEDYFNYYVRFKLGAHIPSKELTIPEIKLNVRSKIGITLLAEIRPSGVWYRYNMSLNKTYIVVNNYNSTLYGLDHIVVFPKI